MWPLEDVDKAVHHALLQFSVPGRCCGSFRVAFAIYLGSTRL